jgi:hypothetical protein
VPVEIAKLIPRADADVVTPLIWRAREESAALLAPKNELCRRVRDGRAVDAPSGSAGTPSRP